MNSAPSSRLSTNWTARRVILSTVVFLLVVAAFYLAFRFRLVIIDLFFAVVFSTALYPLIGWLERKRIPRVISSAILLILIFIISVSLVAAIVPAIGSQMPVITNSAINLYQNLRLNLLQAESPFFQRLGQELPQSLQISLPESQATNNTFIPFAQVFSIGNAFLNGLLTFAALLLLTYYWIQERDKIQTSLLNLLSERKRASGEQFLVDLEKKVGGYLQGLTITCLVYGIVSGIIFFAVGIPFSLPLGALAGILNIVPIVGPAAGWITASLVALAIDPSILLWLFPAFILVQVLVNEFLYPRLIKGIVGLNPVINLLAFAAFGSLFGAVGALLAIPLAVVLQLIFSKLLPQKETPGSLPDEINLQGDLLFVAEELQLITQNRRPRQDPSLVETSQELENIILAVEKIISLPKQNQEGGEE